ncbi:hypothetical protein GWK47_053276 [Chionoecetes opilio]|uniref:Uncharacterized protein n=1 Tax=Chionoecetes opilio TaxID=41210 RepID=A0A8J5C985_CHIOP|nr:hypothetical protein GWK47_053276 [Chionoecetes opilio]
MPVCTGPYAGVETEVKAVVLLLTPEPWAPSWPLVIRKVLFNSRYISTRHILTPPALSHAVQQMEVMEEGEGHLSNREPSSGRAPLPPRLYSPGPGITKRGCLRPTDGGTGEEREGGGREAVSFRIWRHAIAAQNPP